MELRDLIRSARESRKMNQTDAAKLVGMSQQWLYKLEAENRGDEAKVLELAKVLGIPDDQAVAALANRTFTPRPPAPSNVTQFVRSMAPSVPPTNIARVSDLAVTHAEPRMIPVMGYAAGALPGNGHLIMGEQRALVPCPPTLANVEGAYAVYVSGTSMMPRYRPGELLFIHPLKEPVAGDYVVAQIEDQDTGELQGYVKQFVGWQGDDLVLSQHNPEREMRFPADHVHAVNKIVISMV